MSITELHSVFLGHDDEDCSRGRRSSDPFGRSVLPTTRRWREPAHICALSLKHPGYLTATKMSEKIEAGSRRWDLESESEYRFELDAGTSLAIKVGFSCHRTHR